MTDEIKTLRQWQKAVGTQEKLAALLELKQSTISGHISVGTVPLDLVDRYKAVAKIRDLPWREEWERKPPLPEQLAAELKKSGTAEGCAA